jgi:hypothetical protein
MDNKTLLKTAHDRISQKRKQGYDMTIAEYLYVILESYLKAYEKTKDHRDRIISNRYIQQLNHELKNAKKLPQYYEFELL